MFWQQHMEDDDGSGQKISDMGAGLFGDGHGLGHFYGSIA
jgi:hypothetical protein